MTGSHRRILVVEDDPETAGQLVEQLTTSGYQVDLASNGNEALSRGGGSDYAVITIDRMLPDIDGLAIMRQLRDDGVAAPFLIISAACAPAATITWSSRFPSWNCWRGWRRSAAAATLSPRKPSCASAISPST
jgi:CheY-like chemotaxis protein